MQEQLKSFSNPSSNTEERIVLSLPNAPEYVSVARLTLAGIANRMGFNIEAVSYTHLDVYKRQGPSRASHGRYTCRTGPLTSMHSTTFDHVNGILPRRAASARLSYHCERICITTTLKKGGATGS